MKRIGLIAGNRRFPLLIADAARRRGVSVVCVAIRSETDRSIARLADAVHWISLGEFSRMARIFQDEGVTEVIMAGQVSPWKLFSKEVKNSPEIQQILADIQDKRANTIFASLAGKLKQAGITLLPSTTFVEELLPGPGILTRRQPSADEWEDIRFGAGIARRIAEMDIGLSVGIKHKAVVAVEALEGTDNLILRSGRIGGKGTAIVKVGRPGQDMRFDIPVIGLRTVQKLAKAGAGCLAIEHGKTLFIDMQPALALADRKALSIVAI